MDKFEIASWFEGLQDHICAEIEKADSTGTFKEDKWERPGGGGGRSRIIENGLVIEKGGVNFSAVQGKLPSNVREALKVHSSGFFASGISIVMHPQNPFVPIIHMNVRYFELEGGIKWFGGGIDLTPHYIDKDDAKYFHSFLKKICDRFHPSYYDDFKKWADDYFYIKHREETRGVGGIFFDRLTNPDEEKLEGIFNFVKSVGSGFAPLYTYFMNKNSRLPYTESNKQWQLLRRGRYVEFNLVYDKGTKFGLDTNGRIESILMSLPPYASWLYNYIPESGTAEEQTLNQLKKDINWINC